MDQGFLDHILQAHQRPKTLPSAEEIDIFISQLMQFLFPELGTTRLSTRHEVETRAQVLLLDFKKLLYRTESCSNDLIDSKCKLFFDRLPSTYNLCLEDVQAIFDGDPAAKDLEQIISSYPGFYAIAVYRIAHSMHQLRIPYLPRIFTEYAHSKTGIDIHPGAQIGKRFCIDHGTGIVIGETTIIGHDVKLYQGVTLGAMSVEKSMAEQKRHPSIGNHVVIYAGATILGGDTFVADHCIIGGNVWITHSVDPYTIVYYNAKENQHIKESIL